VDGRRVLLPLVFHSGAAMMSLMGISVISRSTIYCQPTAFSFRSAVYGLGAYFTVWLARYRRQRRSLFS
jgi:hypothetical protein